MEDVAAQWLGRVIDGRYVVEGVLGAGGMGVVLRARHKFTGGQLAVKVLRPELASNATLQQRFLNEARAPNMIGHPGIAQTTDAGKSSDGLLYLAMELLQGRSLRVAVAKDELSAQDVRRILLELLDALIAAHARAFVHRDLKPDNVFLVEPNSTMKLLDFGIAKVVDDSLPHARTQAGSPMGTPAYMSPEQIHDPSKVDARTDLWAVGVMMYELLTRRLPWEGGNIGALLATIATQPPTPITTHMPTATPQLVDFFAKVFSRDPSKRFRDATEMKQALWSMPFGTTTASGSGQNMTLSSASGIPAYRSASASGVAATALPSSVGVATPAPFHAPPSVQAPTAGTPQPMGPAPIGQTPHPAGYHSVVQKPSHATPIVIGAVGVVGIVAIVLAIVLTRTQPSAPMQTGPGSQVAMVIDAAVVVPVIVDAAPPPPDAASVPRDPKKSRTKTDPIVHAGSTPEDPYKTPPHGPITAKIDPPQAVPPIKSAPAGEIVDKAAAHLQNVTRCTAAATGNGSCKDAMNCVIDGKGQSVCACATAMSVAHARLFTQWWQCYAGCPKNTTYQDCLLSCGRQYGATCQGQ